MCNKTTLNFKYKDGVLAEETQNGFSSVQKQSHWYLPRQVAEEKDQDDAQQDHGHPEILRGHRLMLYRPKQLGIGQMKLL